MTKDMFRDTPESLEMYIREEAHHRMKYPMHDSAWYFRQAVDKYCETVYLRDLADILATEIHQRYKERFPEHDQ